MVEPVLNAGQPPHLYEPGTWGPEEADPIIAGSGGWDNPAVIPMISNPCRFRHLAFLVKILNVCAFSWCTAS